jgi:hypothetical protein
LRWTAALMPEMPAPTISTSKCSIAIFDPLIFVADDCAYRQGCQLQPNAFGREGDYTNSESAGSSHLT